MAICINKDAHSCAQKVNLMTKNVLKIFKNSTGINRVWRKQVCYYKLMEKNKKRNKC